MLRRKPTRIELKAEDIQEYEEIKRKRDAERSKNQPRVVNINSQQQKSTSERIGFTQQQLQQ